MIDLSRFLDPIGAEATFVLLEPETGQIMLHDSAQAHLCTLPASTFKIPHTLIALETGVLADTGVVQQFALQNLSPQAWWPATWPRDHSLASAFRNSVVWYYQAVARRIGEQQMTDWLRKLAYGNQSCSPEIDSFWLSGSLAISAMEQVDFLQRLHENALPVQEKHAEILKQLMRLDVEDDVKIYGKTGTAITRDNLGIAWLTGYIEAEQRTWIYALRVSGETRLAKMAFQQQNKAVKKRFLQHINVLPAVRKNVLEH